MDTGYVISLIAELVDLCPPSPPNQFFFDFMFLENWQNYKLENPLIPELSGDDGFH